jgi:hypothetical protein
MGYSLRLGEDGAAGTGTIRLPKLHTQYDYFDLQGNTINQYETITRVASGRFIYEDATGKGSFPVNVTAKNIKLGDTYLVGNPFMTHINIEKFIAGNAAAGITSVKVYDGSGSNSAIELEGDGFVSNDGSTLTHIAPMQSFFITANSGAEVALTFTADMLENAPAQLMRSTRAAGSSTVSNALKLTATVGKTTSNSLVRLNASAKDAYRAGEDARILIDNEVRPTVAIFTIAGEEALDIQQLSTSATRIPVGISMRNPARVSLTLAHRSGDAWAGWSLVDTQTGKRTSLQNGEVTIDLGILKSNVGRFYLEKN